MTTKKTGTPVTIVDFDAALQLVNDCCKTTDVDVATMENAINDLNEIERQLAKATKLGVYDHLTSIKDAIVQFDYTVVGHKPIKSDAGQIVGYARRDVKKEIDIVDLCRYKNGADGFDVAWYGQVELLNLRFTLRVAKDLELSDAEIQAINDSFYMKKWLGDRPAGTPDPVSNTTLLKGMQNILDAMVPNGGLCRKEDLMMAVHSYARLARSKGDGRQAKKVLRCATTGQFVKILVNVYNRIIEGRQYAVQYKAAKQ